jgi:hypothetical protein
MSARIDLCTSERSKHCTCYDHWGYCCYCHSARIPRQDPHEKLEQNTVSFGAAPIETAPKDRVILLWIEVPGYAPLWWLGIWDPEYNEWAVLVPALLQGKQLHLRGVEPTHWKDLPPAP